MRKAWIFKALDSRDDEERCLDDLICEVTAARGDCPIRCRGINHASATFWQLMVLWKWFPFTCLSTQTLRRASGRSALLHLGMTKDTRLRARLHWLFDTMSILSLTDSEVKRRTVPIRTSTFECRVPMKRLFSEKRSVMLRKAVATRPLTLLGELQPFCGHVKTCVLVTTLSLFDTLSKQCICT